MKKRYGIALAIVMAVPAIATAGEKLKAEVNVNTYYQFAEGSMGSVRNSRDSIQYIGCYSAANRDGFLGFCKARDASGVIRACSTNQEHLVRQMTAVTDSAYIYFAWGEFGECAWIEVGNHSWWEPRK